MAKARSDREPLATVTTRGCRLEAEALMRANAWLERYREIWEANYQRFDAMLEEPGGAPKTARPAGAPGATCHAGARPRAARTWSDWNPIKPGRPRVARRWPR